MTLAIGKSSGGRGVAVFMALTVSCPWPALAQGGGPQDQAFKPEEYYRILTGQGPAAPGGAYSYLAHGQMIGGFALVAYPAEWGSSGVMTFIVNHDGVVLPEEPGPEDGRDRERDEHVQS
jgi:Protein of unknown function (DUF2950)